MRRPSKAIRATCLAAASILIVGIPRPAGSQISIRATGPFDQPLEHSYLLHSDAVGRDFVVRVFAPPGPQPTTRLPVIYALDEGYDIAGPAVRTLGGAMAPAFVVEIGYAPPDFHYRMTDLLFDRVRTGSVEEGGGGAAFEAFLLGELRPWIEARFQVDPARSILMGHSAAGFFAAKVLATKPGAFSGYILASPSFQYEPALVAALGKTSAPTPTRAFISVGGDEKPEMIAGAKSALDALGRPGSGFTVREQVFAGLGHGATYLMLPLTAYPFLLPPKGP